MRPPGTRDGRRSPEPGGTAASIVVMGVSGAGKSTVAAALAERLGRDYLDADDLHPPANRAKLGAGLPLTDLDRAPWLAAVAEWIDGHGATVVACSALRRPYRDRLRAARTPVWFVHLDPPAPVVATRMQRRTGHFMPARQLPDQLATLEPLQPDEAGIRLRGREDLARVVARIETAVAAAGLA